MWGRKKEETVKDPTADWPDPSPGWGPSELNFDWTDTDMNFLTVDYDGTCKKHAWFAHLRSDGRTWTSSDWLECGKITPPREACQYSYWMRPSLYKEHYGR